MAERSSVSAGAVHVQPSCGAAVGGTAAAAGPWRVPGSCGGGQGRRGSVAGQMCMLTSGASVRRQYSFCAASVQLQPSGPAQQRCLSTRQPPQHMRASGHHRHRQLRHPPAHRCACTAPAPGLSRTAGCRQLASGGHQAAAAGTAASTVGRHKLASASRRQDADSRICRKPPPRLCNDNSPSCAQSCYGL